MSPNFICHITTFSARRFASGQGGTVGVQDFDVSSLADLRTQPSIAWILPVEAWNHEDAQSQALHAWNNGDGELTTGGRMAGVIQPEAKPNSLNMPKKAPKNTDTALAKIEPQAIEPQSMQLPREMIERDPLGACAYFAACAKRAQLISLAAQVFAGAAISKIKSDIGITSGKRTDLANDERLKDGWDKYCKNTLGISRDTAANWERIAKLVASKIDGIEGLTAASLERFSELADDAFNQLQKAISKVTDGKSQSQLLLEWQMCNGGAKRGTSPSGDGGGGNDAPQGTPPGYTDEEFEEYLAADQTGKAAIDHARSLIFALRQFEAVPTLLVHIPEHYATEIEERANQVVEVLP